MVTFTKLRLNGFKSFADSTDIDIGPGMTGIVGPNGCGKSNLVEAIRWVMGESSAKRMRGGGMEDVIFGGTDKRSPKNRANVSLILDNADKQAPAPFNNDDQLEVTRTIERDQGSTYRVNSKAVRARDVQMFFGDIVAGANSPALVSQGRVTLMINAKPSERRQILEESAGVSGLYVRRHEAELRLKAAENNLIRLDDLMGELEKRYDALQKQVRQANRYKNLSQTVRELDLLRLYIEFTQAQSVLDKNTDAHNQIETAIKDIMIEITQLTSSKTKTSADLPKLKEDDNKFAAQLQTLFIEKRALEDSLKRIDDDKNSAQRTIEQAEQNILQDQELISASETSLTLRKTELQDLENKSDETSQIEEKQQLLEQLKQTLQSCETELESKRSSEAQSRAEKEMAQKTITNLQDDEKELLETIQKLKKELNEYTSTSDSMSKIASLKQEITALKAQQAHQEESRQTQRIALEELQNEIDILEQNWHELNTENSKISSEINVINNFLKSKNEEEKTAVLQKIQPKKGYEIALAKALGDSLLAALDDKEANQYWQKLSRTPQDLPELTALLEPLSSKVKAPEALSICLSQIGVVDGTVDNQEDIFGALKPGQMAVTKDGDVYRWDGYVITSKSQSATALHLERKNKLERLEEELKVIEEKQTALSIRLDQEKNKKVKLSDAIKSHDEEISHLKASIENKTTETDTLETSVKQNSQQVIRLEERIASNETRLSTIKQDIENAKENAINAEKTENAVDRAALEKLQTKIYGLRQEISELNRICDKLTFERENRLNRVDILKTDIEDLEKRIQTGKTRIETLKTQQTEAKKKQEELLNKPDQIQKQLEEFLDKIDELEKDRISTTESLQALENNIRDIDQQLKDQESKLSLEKEKRAGLNAYIESAQEKISTLEIEIKNHDFTNSTDILKAIEWPEDKPLPDLNETKAKIEQTKSQRDNMGAVNLMAAEEAEAAHSELSTMREERDDLTQAIDKLRHVIQKLNKEARERMKEAFDSVNAHFQKLFVRLFGGGQAHLELSQSEDILESGLEIFAQPPGKRLQNLSLLSGGEQTLTSIALIFAMFLTKPAPICVLDEIDAPLDDANVDRICSMIEEIAQNTDTRFLIITHHRMTMARMDRLYGVTMAERGISKLVSVDLQQTLFEGDGSQKAA